MILDINEFASEILISTYIHSPTLSRQIAVDLLYDTGCTSLSFSKIFLEEHRFPIVGTVTVHTAKGLTQSDKYGISDFWILGKDFGDVVSTSCLLRGLDYDKDERPQYTGLVGFKFIRAFNTNLDFDSKMITFSPRDDYINKIKFSSGFIATDAEIERDMLHLEARGGNIMPDYRPLYKTK